jgi:hypothetical protein
MDPVEELVVYQHALVLWRIGVVVQIRSVVQEEGDTFLCIFKHHHHHPLEHHAALFSLSSRTFFLAIIDTRRAGNGPVAGARTGHGVVDGIGRTTKGRAVPAARSKGRAIPTKAAAA